MSSIGKRVAVVTGSNKGIGFAIVKALCSQFDGDVILAARDEGRGADAVEKLKKVRRDFFLNYRYSILIHFKVPNRHTGYCYDDDGDAFYL